MSNTSICKTAWLLQSSCASDRREIGQLLQTPEGRADIQSGLKIYLDEWLSPEPYDHMDIYHMGAMFGRFTIIPGVETMVRQTVCGDVLGDSSTAQRIIALFHEGMSHGSASRKPELVACNECIKR